MKFWNAIWVRIIHSNIYAGGGGGVCRPFLQETSFFTVPVCWVKVLTVNKDKGAFPLVKTQRYIGKKRFGVFFPRVHLLVSCKVESVAELGTSVPIALNQRCSPVSVLPLKL